MEAPSWKKESFCTILEGQPIDDDINSVDDSILMDVIFLGFEGLDCYFRV